MRKSKQKAGESGGCKLASAAGYCTVSCPAATRQIGDIFSDLERPGFCRRRPDGGPALIGLPRSTYEQLKQAKAGFEVVGQCLASSMKCLAAQVLVTLSVTFCSSHRSEQPADFQASRLVLSAYRKAGRTLKLQPSYACGTCNGHSPEIANLPSRS